LSVAACGEFPQSVGQPTAGNRIDQSKVVQALNDGSHLVDAGTKKYPTLNMTAQVNPGSTGARVVGLSFAAESC
jgi:hypothetical protein